MKMNTLEWLAVAWIASVAGHVAAAESDDSLAGTWSLDDRSSDDPVAQIDGKHGGDGLGRRIVRSINVFGIPVGSLPLPGDEKEEEPLTPEQLAGALAYVFEATYRLRIAQDEETTEIRYGNAPAVVYRSSATLQRNGWTSKAEWRDGELTIEHERAADGAHVSERYWVEPRADELHWTARFKRPKSRTVESRTVDVKRVLYRAPGDQDARLQLTAQLSP
jgi:hypothetical protein